MTEKSILPPAWAIPQAFRSRLGARVGRQRAMTADGHLLLVLHAPPKPEDDTRIGRFFWRSPDGTWSSNELGRGISALNRHLDEYENLITSLDQQEEQAETAEDYFRVLKRLTPIHRSVCNQHQVLQEARKESPEYRDIIDVRDRSYTIERTVELLFGGTKNSLDYTVAKRAEEQSQASQRMAAATHRLNILAAFFFPIVTLTAILGVDMETVSGIFGFEVLLRETRILYPITFTALVLLGLLLGAILTTFVMRGDQNGRARNGERKATRKFS